MACILPPGPGRPYIQVDAVHESDILHLHATVITDLYKTHGALLFRGFGVDIAKFGAFTAQFCSSSVVNESPGRAPLDVTRNIHTVDKGNAPFSLHPELSREPWKPDVAFFACQSAPTRGGETTLCDGVEIVREMPDFVREGLTGRRLVYIQKTWPGLFEFWLGASNPTAALLTNPPGSCPYRFASSGNSIVRLFSRPALHKPMFADDLAFGNFLLFARFNNGRTNFPVLDDGQPVPEAWLQAIKATGDRLAVRVKWHAGDVLMLDNTRFMHGRTEILDTQERRIATYFGYLRFAVPGPDEPAEAPWRSADFCPPQSPALAAYR
jgi:alpha-ketoglutarate-dependent taurine dioxygenase